MKKKESLNLWEILRDLVHTDKLMNCTSCNTDDMSRYDFLILEYIEWRQGSATYNNMFLHFLGHLNIYCSHHICLNKQKYDAKMKHLKHLNFTDFICRLKYTHTHRLFVTFFFTVFFFFTLCMHLHTCRYMKGI